MAEAPARFGRYERVALLGRGAFAEVWRADLVGIGGFRKPVALKLLHKGRDRQADQTLLEEARLGALLHHPHIAETYDVGEVDGRVYVAMELVDGVTLRDLLARVERLPVPVAIELGRQCLLALEYAHELTHQGQPLGLVHRDIKPANILLDLTGRAKLVDFGVAFARGFSGDEATGAGTPGYVAPESMRAERPDRRADLFGLAVVLAEAVTGRRPWPARPLDAYRAAVADPPRAFTESGVGPALEALAPGLAPVLLRCLEPEVQRRPKDAQELWTRLEPWKGHGAGLAELVARARKTAAPPPPVRRASDLPPLPDAFFGREAEKEALALHLGRHRVTAILGVAGVGKSRLALEMAWSAQESFPGGAFWLDLAQAKGADELRRALARRLGLPADPLDGEPGSADLGAALERRGRVLVVLDHVDPLLDELDLLVRLARRAPRSRFLLTTRERPDLPGVATLRLEGLSPPDALKLFRERAQVDGREPLGGDLEALVGGLEGLPLALELAAARARSGSTRWFSGRPEPSDGSSERRRTERHATMQDALAWSWNRLPRSEKAALAQLSVFRGGFGFELGAAILDFPSDQGALPATVLSALIDKSLLRVVDTNGPRLGFYEAIHRFASHALAEDPDVGGAEALRQAEERHAQRLADRIDPRSLEGLDQAGGPAAQRLLLEETDNLVVALRRATDHRWVGVIPRLVLGLAEALRRGGSGRTGERALSAVLRLSDLPRATRALVLLERADLLGGRGRLSTVEGDLKEALELARAVEDPSLEARALRLLGHLARARGEMREARHQLHQAQRLARQAGDELLEARILGSLAKLEHQLGRGGVGRGLLSQALKLAQAAGSVALEATLVGDLAALDLETGRDVGGEGLLRAIQLHEAVGNTNAAEVARSNLASLRFRQGERELAKQLWEESAAKHAALGNRRSEMVTRLNLATLIETDGAAAQAALEDLAQQFQELGDRRFEAIALGNAGERAAADGRREAARDLLQRGAQAAARAQDPVAEGAFGGALAELEADLDPQRALQGLEAVEPLLRRGTHAEELARHLIRKGRVLLRLRELLLARAALQEAREHQERAGHRPGSPLVAEAEALQTAIARVASDGGDGGSRRP